MICLYFGSFNPIHWGHITLARYAHTELHCDEVWLLLSPLNPQKKRTELWSYTLRKDLLLEAISSYNYMRLCQIEYTMPKPYYTWRTLRALKLLYPKEQFAMLIGSDNLKIFKTWYKWVEIQKLVRLYVYPRSGYLLDRDDTDLQGLDYTLCLDADVCDISSTDIRRQYNL